MLFCRSWYEVNKRAEVCVVAYINSAWSPYSSQECRWRNPWEKRHAQELMELLISPESAGYSGEKRRFSWHNSVTPSEESQAIWDCQAAGPPLQGLPHAEAFSSKGAFRPFSPLLVAQTVQMSSRRSPGHCSCQRRTAMYLCIVKHILNEALWMEISLPCIINSSFTGQIKQNLSLKDLAVLLLPYKKITYPLPPSLQDNHCHLHCHPGHRYLRHTAVLLFAEAGEGRATTSPS